MQKSHIIVHSSKNPVSNNETPNKRRPLIFDRETSNILPNDLLDYESDAIADPSMMNFFRESMRPLDEGLNHHDDPIILKKTSSNTEYLDPKGNELYFGMGLPDIPENSHSNIAFKESSIGSSCSDQTEKMEWNRIGIHNNDNRIGADNNIKSVSACSSVTSPSGMITKPTKQSKIYTIIGKPPSFAPPAPPASPAPQLSQEEMYRLELEREKHQNYNRSKTVFINEGGIVYDKKYAQKVKREAALHDKEELKQFKSFESLKSQDEEYGSMNKEDNSAFWGSMYNNNNNNNYYYEDYKTINDDSAENNYYNNRNPNDEFYRFQTPSENNKTNKEDYTFDKKQQNHEKVSTDILANMLFNKKPASSKGQLKKTLSESFEERQDEFINNNNNNLKPNNNNNNYKDSHFSKEQKNFRQTENVVNKHRPNNEVVNEVVNEFLEKGMYRFAEKPVKKVPFEIKPLEPPSSKKFTYESPIGAGQTFEEPIKMDEFILQSKAYADKPAEKPDKKSNPNQSRHESLIDEVGDEAIEDEEMNEWAVNMMEEIKKEHLENDNDKNFTDRDYELLKESTNKLVPSLQMGKSKGRQKNERETYNPKALVDDNRSQYSRKSRKSESKSIKSRKSKKNSINDNNNNQLHHVNSLNPAGERTSKTNRPTTTKYISSIAELQSEQNHRLPKQARRHTETIAEELDYFDNTETDENEPESSYNISLENRTDKTGGFRSQNEGSSETHQTSENHICSHSSFQNRIPEENYLRVTDPGSNMIKSTETRKSHKNKPSLYGYSNKKAMSTISEDRNNKIEIINGKKSDIYSATDDILSRQSYQSRKSHKSSLLKNQKPNNPNPNSISLLSNRLSSTEQKEIVDKFKLLNMTLYLNVNKILKMKPKKSIQHKHNAMKEKLRSVLDKLTPEELAYNPYAPVVPMTQEEQFQSISGQLTYLTQQIREELPMIRNQIMKNQQQINHLEQQMQYKSLSHENKYLAVLQKMKHQESQLYEKERHIHIKQSQLHKYQDELINIREDLRQEDEEMAYIEKEMYFESRMDEIKRYNTILCERILKEKEKENMELKMLQMKVEMARSGKSGKSGKSVESGCEIDISCSKNNSNMLMENVLEEEEEEIEFEEELKEQELSSQEKFLETENTFGKRTTPTREQQRERFNLNNNKQFRESNKQSYQSNNNHHHHFGHDHHHNYIKHEQQPLPLHSQSQLNPIDELNEIDHNLNMLREFKKNRKEFKEATTTGRRSERYPIDVKDYKYFNILPVT